MAHIEQKEFVERVKTKYSNYFFNKKVLDVGSLDVNGTNRIFFTDCEYVGIDIGEGPGVDIVCSGHVYDAPDGEYDVVCSTECFEHNPYWFETFENMIRLCKSGGLIFFTCASEGREEHGTSKSWPEASPFVSAGWDYYKNLNMEDFINNFNLLHDFNLYSFEYNGYVSDLYFFGIKK